MKELDISSDLARVKQSIIHFINTYVEERDFDGALVWFSGYIDSTIITKLTLEALGVESVKVLIRSEKYSEAYKEILANSIDYLKIDEENIERCNIDEITKKFGSRTLVEGSVREIPLLYEPLSYSLLKTSVKSDIEGKTYGMVGKATSGREKLIHRILAHNKLRSRIQMASAYFIAETENRCLIGTKNKTELLTGLFTKWGYGHCADLMPLGHLYRTQILQLAKYLDIPENITTVSKVDLLPGIKNKYEYFFDLSAFDVDKILVGLESGKSKKEIKKVIGLNRDKIEKVHKYFVSSRHTKAAPLLLKNYF